MSKDMNKDMFTFVNDIESDIVEQVEKKEEQNSKKPRLSVIPDDERYERVKLVKAVLIMLMLSAAIFVLAMIWQDDTSLMGIVNALWLVIVLEFFFGWMMLMNNMNILSPLVYGAKTFFKVIIGKRMKTDYYTYMKLKEEKPIPPFYYRICFIGALIFAVPGIILLFIV
ncbi:MAG: hypothetical protein JXR88_13985 [Clostridia bacterium]|nr:hypothetical protein [Clostridia bacterium]